MLVHHPLKARATFGILSLVPNAWTVPWSPRGEKLYPPNVFLYMKHQAKAKEQTRLGFSDYWQPVPHLLLQLPGPAHVVWATKGYYFFPLDKDFLLLTQPMGSWQVDCNLCCICMPVNFSIAQAQLKTRAYVTRKSVHNHGKCHTLSSPQKKKIPALPTANSAHTSWDKHNGNCSLDVPCPSWQETGVGWGLIHHQML